MRKLTMFTLLALWAIGPVHAAEFFCPSGDVSCLIAAINKANRNDQQNTIFLEPGNYILLAVDNRSLDDGATGLPIVTGTITIWGAGAESTTIERDADAAEFRIFHVAATGNLTLEKLTIRGGSTVLFVGGLSEVGGGILNQGIIAIGHSIVLDNIARRNGSIFNLGGTMTINNSIIFDNSVAAAVVEVSPILMARYQSTTAPSREMPSAMVPAAVSLTYPPEVSGQ
jgi:hypothetical protein